MKKKRLILTKKDIIKLNKFRQSFYKIKKILKKKKTITLSKSKIKPIIKFNFKSRIRMKRFKFRSKVFLTKNLRYRKYIFTKFKLKKKKFNSIKIKNKFKKFIKTTKINKIYKLFKIIHRKSIYVNTIINKRYLNFIVIATCNKHFFLSKLELIFLNNVYFFKMFSIFAFLFKLNYFFINIFIKKYEFFYYYNDLINFNENLKDLNKFIVVLKENKFNFIYFYKIIFEKILLVETYLKQFFFNIIKLKKNCFKYKYFFFNIIKYLIILKKKYLYFTTLDLFLRIIDKKYLLSEKFNNKFMNLCSLNKKCLLTLKKRIKNKYKINLIKKKTKKYYRYIARGLKEYKKKNKQTLILK